MSDPLKDPLNDPLDDRDWEWRRRIRANAHSHRIYRWVVAVVGLLIVLGGLALVPLPGPGWLVVLFGIIVWASEFAWAGRLRDWVRERLRLWNGWMLRQGWAVRSLVLVGTGAVVAGLFYLLFLVSGVPGLMPDVVERWVTRLPGL
ncbi:PGPGW domain-containing protein [Nostocoides sp. HKS02]|uniref:PGPGW domain-containing protein n=1 Tax=Nostocoides sp. HKS02 TaxID=1813880 RepID=UPI0018A843AF|nr:PGPGW domain-containing protein [Tetrasphaera sp. HKS02]